MPQTISDYSADAGLLPICYRAVATADVAIGVPATYVIGATLGTLPAGTYEISGNISVLNGAGAAFVNGRINIGGVFYATTETSCIAAGACMVTIPKFTVHIPVAAVVNIEATSTTATGTTKFVTINGGALPGATWINAVRIK